MTDTETTGVEVRGRNYLIKRFNFDESNAVDDYSEAHKDKRNEGIAFIVFSGTIKEDGTPYFESVEAVKKEDHETVNRLWFEIDRFNKYDATFLLLLKNSSQQAARLAGTNPL